MSATKRSELLKTIVVANLLLSQFTIAEDKQDRKKDESNDGTQIYDLEDIDISLVPQHNGVCSNGSCK